MGDRNEGEIQIINAVDACARIVETVQQAPKGDAPFALVLGAGFSAGLVPMARELVTKNLPLWMKAVTEHESYAPEDLPPADVPKIAGEFWRRFVKANGSRRLNFELGSNGLPTNYIEAYKAAFDPKLCGAVGAPALGRRLQRDLIRADRPRLNAAHFLLGSILGVQPGKARESRHFKAQAAFSRLILTTNFDPFLQIALQAVNRLYFMTDTPDLEVSDEISDDHSDAIHLVYVHGSVHRRIQLTSNDDIQGLKQANKRTLSSVLKRRGVIVVGHSGWDDVIVEALATCDQFDHRLYWCGLEPDPQVKGAFGERVPELLRKPSALYVHTPYGAGRFMAQLSNRLVDGLPRLLDNPIAQIREMLETIDLRELRDLVASPAALADDQKLDSAPRESLAFHDQQMLTMDRLRRAERDFCGGTPPIDETTSGVPIEKAGRFEVVVELVGSRATDRAYLPAIRLAAVLGNFEEALELANRALSAPDTTAEDELELKLARGRLHHVLGTRELAIKDWTEVIDSTVAKSDHLIEALFNRGVTHALNGRFDEAIADYTRVIETAPSTSRNRVATTLFNRGVTWGLKGNPDEALADYTKVIDDFSDAPTEVLARALYNRGAAWSAVGNPKEAIADYTRVIDGLTDVPVEQVARALQNRGVAWGATGQNDQAKEDFTRIVDGLPGALAEQTGLALYNRGIAWSKAGDRDKAIADYTRVIEESPGAPVAQVAQALNNRGALWGEVGNSDMALADFTRVIEGMSGVPVEQIAQALNNRGVAWCERGEVDRSLADYTTIIDVLSGVPLAQIASTLDNRGLAQMKNGQIDKALADFTRVIEGLPSAPIDTIAKALLHRGVAWHEKGNPLNAMADFSRVIDEVPEASTEQRARALNNRGVALEEAGHREAALADYSRVIAGLPGATRESIAQALLNRGRLTADSGDSKEALADFSRVIDEFADMRAQVATALTNRGWERFKTGDVGGFLEDTRGALARDTSDVAAFNFGLALLANGRDAEALEAYRQAGIQSPLSIDGMGIADLVEAQGSWLPAERAQPAIQLLESIKITHQATNGPHE